MKWTLDSLNDSDSEDQDKSLPQPKEISRAALAADDFDAQRFLSEHAAYRTLQDIHASVREWELKLQAELLNTVNAEFDDFVGAVESVEAGEPPLRSVQAEIAKFEMQAAFNATELEKASEALETELLAHKRLSQKESSAHTLQYMYDLLDDLEQGVPEASVGDSASLLTLAKLYVAMLAVATDMRTVKAVEILHASFESVRNELSRKLDESIAAATIPESKLELLEAREHVRLIDTEFQNSVWQE